MTNDEKIATLHQAEDVCYDALKEEKNPLNIKYIMDALGAVNFEIGQLTRHADSNVVCVPSITPAAQETVESVEPASYTIDQVRAALVKAREEKGIVIGDVLRKFGVTKMSELPEEKYADVMEELKNG